ncbi:L-xylulose reductase-like [Mercenaria mercenaria]|uniref:L-xylulose reductase-like n=1 Tax=Mercenaria mercenaria TaxID=6596 RepID=UPI00234ECDFA|nr:L-xylulose reductase-like [Mercenaria mercenaria]
MPFDFNGKKVLVTGAGKGIGRAVAIALNEAGCKVYALSRTKSTLDSLVAEHPKIVPMLANLSNWDDARRMLEDLEPLDGLVNNAGILEERYSVVDCPRDYIIKILDTNLLGAINCAQVVAKKMIDSKIKGSIVNISSVAGIGSFYTYLPYSVSKAGLDMVTKQFALELGPYQIRVNSVNPTLVMTPMISSLKDGLDLQYEKGFIARTPMGRIAKVEESVGPVLYLLSDYSSMVSGQMHPVDGGMLSNVAVKI